MPAPTAKSVLLKVRVPASPAKRIEAYAKAAKRTKPWVIEDILDRHIDNEIASAEAVNEGLREPDAGLGVPHEETVRQIRAHIVVRKRERRKAA